ncbi:gp182 [Sphingomonas phage PAU]|uniref:thymidylate synthase n=1 Tax=Sphingomonas phage PAU TaxID=1150991 RepID=UPI0002573302|nr:thymidylate synthase [Sphingomonas phage PAU]AFF28180.1 gp182 [Sphingomonas phage PAU]
MTKIQDKQEFDSLDEAYLTLLKSLIDLEPNELGEREMFGIAFDIKNIDETDPKTNFSKIKERNINLVFQNAFARWLMSGSNSADELLPLNKRTSQFNEIEGRNLLYPPRIQNQIYDIVDELTENPMSRRATLLILDERDQIVRKEKREKSDCKKEYPCTIALHFFIRNNRLHSNVMMRSNNAVKTICFDFSNFAFVQNCIARELDLKAGTMHYYISNAHILPEDYEHALKICEAN